MKDLELQKAIDARFEYNARFPERMNQQLGLKLLDCSREELFVDFAFDNDREVWLNPYGGVHGGVICTLFDTCMGYGAAALSNGFVSTTDLSVSYLARMSGDAFNMHIDYNHIGKRLLNATCRFTVPETGKVCAVAQGTFYILGDLGRDFDSDLFFEENE